MSLWLIRLGRSVLSQQLVLPGFQDGLDALQAGRGSVREGFLTGALQTLRGIAIRQFQQGHTGLVALLLHLVGGEKEPYHGSSVLADLLRPADETLAIPLQVALVVRRHMPLGDYYGAWRAMEELYKEGKIRAIGVCNFDAARLMDLCYNVDIRPMVNQIERHPHYQRHEELSVMHKLGVQPEGWAPFAEGMKGMFTEPVLREIAAKHEKTVPQVILRWNIQQGVVIIPKSVHQERMEENLAIWDFVLDSDDMDRIAALDKNCPSMLDCSRPSEIDRLYDYLNNPVLTTL